MAQTLWRGVEGDLGAEYAARQGETVVFWGYTSATTDMASLDQFIPPAAPQVPATARVASRVNSRCKQGVNQV